MSFDPARYAKWRAQFKWTDEEFAAVMEAESERWALDGNEYKARQYHKRAQAIRAGRLSGYDLGKCLGVLVSYCAICGKKALYRIGPLGRCSAHRLVTEAFKTERLEREELKAACFERRRKEWDYRTLNEKSAKSMAAHKR